MNRLKRAIAQVLAAHEPLESFEDESDRDLDGAIERLREIYEEVKDRI